MPTGPEPTGTLPTGTLPTSTPPTGDSRATRRRQALTCDMVSLPSAHLADIAELLDFVDAFCEQAAIESQDQFDLRLAVEEVCVNVMMHGYARRAPGPLEISFCADGEQATITISDRAAPFNPEHAPPPDLEASIEERPIGGLGWHLVRRIVDDVYYRYDPTYGNTVTLVKRLSPGGDGASENKENPPAARP